jgi:hypothetical protein
LKCAFWKAKQNRNLEIFIDMRFNVRSLICLIILSSISAFAGTPVTVTMTSPASGATVSSPVRVAASASSTAKVTGWWIYVDGKGVYNTGATTSISTNISLASGTHTIMARAWNSNGTYGSASRSVTVPTSPTTDPTVAVAISPTSSSVQTNQTKQFSATVTGTTNTAATWYVAGVAGGNSTVGTISSTGLYTAPATVPSTNPVTVMARSSYDTTKSASASVTLTGATNTSGYNYYVSPSGSDSNDGSASRPWRTIQKAASMVKPGYTVHVAAGTYNTTSTITTSVSGTSSARIRFISDVKWGAKIISSMGMPSSTWRNNGNYVDIVGFDVTGNGNQGIINYASYVRIIENHVHNLPPTMCDLSSPTGAGINSGANYNSSDNDVIGNVVHDIGVPGYMPKAGPQAGTLCTIGQGIYHANARGHISNNISYRNMAYGITLWHSPTANIVTNNIVFGNGYKTSSGSCTGGGIWAGAASGNPTGAVWSNSKVNNNIIYKNGCYSIREYGVIGTNNQFINNVSYGNGRGDAFALLNGNTETGTKRVDPQFVNPTGSYLTGDYHSSASSPAIGTGTSSGVPAEDMDGGTRNTAAPDIGAYEWGSAPGTWPYE